MKQVLLLIAFFTLLLCAVPITAQCVNSDTYASYGLIIGSNRAGQGQHRLSFAHHDAKRMAATLKGVGRFSQGNIAILLDPGKNEVLQAFTAVESKLRQHAKKDEKTLFFFYYSGHAKSTGLNLGTDELSLGDLKRRLKKFSSTVTIVLLDACQAGAISKVKGVTPVADFSYNTVDNLNLEGMAVIASSSASELSQESTKLKGSYFSHHFTVGLRGAADVDKNGVVTLSEAYTYAYHRTLSTTALTAVGRQHATLEMDFKGKGEMVIAWPGNFHSSLQIPRAVEGDILLTHTESGTVAAEIRKVKGQSYTVALEPGSYDGFVRQSRRRGFQCSIHVRSGANNVINLNSCKKMQLEDQSAKGKDIVYAVAKPVSERRREYVMVELQLGYFYSKETPYTRRLEDFRYKGQDSANVISAVMNLIVSPWPYLSIGATVATMDRREGVSNLTSYEQKVSWRSYRIGALVRGNLIHRSAFVVPYLQFGAGFAKADFEFKWNHGAKNGTDIDKFKGFFTSWGGGLQINPTKSVGITVFQVEYCYSQLVEMTEMLDEKHNNGGWSFTTGVRLGY